MDGKERLWIKESRSRGVKWHVASASGHASACNGRYIIGPLNKVHLALPSIGNSCERCIEAIKAGKL